MENITLLMGFWLKQMNNGSEWIPFSEIQPIIDFLNNKEDWLFIYNHKCKYINIRIDMRGGDFRLSDRHDNLITLDDLKQQERGK